MVLPALLLSLVIGQIELPPEPGNSGSSEQTKASPPRVPWYVPRSAVAGAWVQYATVPHVRVLFEPALVDGPWDRFIAYLELSTGVAVGRLPANMTSFHEHLIVLGLGYRNTGRNDVHWGFHAGTGLMIHGASYANGSATELRPVGVVDGAAQLGFRSGGVIYGVQLGYAEPWERYVRSTSVQYVGGFRLGLFANWR